MKKRLTIFVAALMILSILAAPVAAGTIRTDYSGVENFEVALSSGVEWVSEDGIYHVRGAQEAYTDVVSDPRLCGDTVVTINANFQLAAPPVYVYGPMWGTVIIESNDGYWEGSWVGKRTEQGWSYIRGVLHGHGDYEGLKARADYVRESPYATVPFTVHGVLMDPGG
ncbi:MAG: hypothetical protein PVH59_08735 [Anaerolineae bacterium]